MSFPSPITAMKLLVSTGSDTYVQPITPSELSVTTNNSIQIIPNTAMFNAFNNNPAGTIFTPSIVTSYGSDELGNALSIVSTPSVSNFVPRQITPNLSLADISNKLTTDSSFSLSVTTDSTGVLSYSSSSPSVATVNSTTGLVTIVGAGTTTITVNLAASANGVYTAATASRQLVVSAPAAPTQRGFSVLTDDSDFASLDFDSVMTTLFTNHDDGIFSITMPNSNFTFNSAAYATLYLSSNGWLSFGTNLSDPYSGTSPQTPTNTFRYFSWDHVSTGSYKFISNNTRLLFKLSGYKYGDPTRTFTIKVIITQSGEIRTNYTLSSNYTSNQIIIGFVGSYSSATSDDIFLTLNGLTFNGSILLDLYSLLNGKTILYIPENYPTFGPFTLPTVYKNQTITRVLTPPTSNSSGTFTFTSSNTAVATISISGGVSSINVIELGATTITATQAASGDFVSSSVNASLTVTLLYPTFGPFTLPSDELVYQNQTITRVLTPPTSNSSGAFTITSSNTAVATISINDGVSSINVVGGGTTIIGVVQAASGDFVSSSIAVLLNTVTGTSFSTEGVLWNQKGGDIDGEAANNRSGWSVSLSSDGNIVAIGAPYNNGNGTSAGHTRVFIRDPSKTTAVTDQALPNFGPVGWTRLGGDIVGEAAGDNSGYSVSLSSDGNIVAIGADWNSSGTTTSQGHVRVYKYDLNKTAAVTDQSSPNFGPIGWTRLGGDIDGEGTYDYSGRSVSLSADGSIVAIGAFQNSSVTTYGHGHVRVYKYDPTKTTAVTDQASSNFGPVGWTRLGGDIDGEAARDYSGISVSLSSDGTIVAIGAYGNDGNGTNSGHTRVFIRDPSKTTAVTDQASSNFGPVGWTRLGGDIVGEAADDSSGWSVSLSSDGNIVAIGAWANDGNGNNSGHVRVYSYDPTKTTAVTDQALPNFGPIGWTRLGGDIDGEAAGDYSGYSVNLSADGNIVAIGAYGNDGNGTSSGHTRVFIRDSNKTTAVTDQASSNFGPVGWRRLGGDIDGEAAGDYSGRSVSLSSDGNIVAVGATLNDGNGTNSGHTRVFKLQ